MPLFSASQLIGKQIVLNKTVSVYSVFDINNLGDNAKPVTELQKDHFFTLDSYLLPTDGYTSIYGIHYAKRSDLYFTFFDLSKNYLAVKVKSDGRFSLKALRDQGALTVKEEIEKDKYENKTGVEKFFYDIFHGQGAKTLLIVAALSISAAIVLPKILKSNK